MSDWDQRIAVAQRYVEEGRRIVAAQRQRIASGEAVGTEAHDLLAVFERSLEIFELDLDRLLKEADTRY